MPRSSAVTVGATANASDYNKLRTDALGAAQIVPYEQATPDLTLLVAAGVYYLGSKKIYFAGGNSPSFTAPSENPRIDLLVIDTAGTLSRVAGTEAASPAAPTYPAGYLVICEVYNVVGQTTIRDVNTAGQGYFYREARPVVSDQGYPRIRTSYNFKDSGPFISATSGAGSPTVTFDSGGRLRLQTGTSASGVNAHARLELSGSAEDLNLFDYDPDFYAIILLGTNLGAGQTKRGFVVFGDAITQDSYTTSRHFGFEVRCNDGTEELYATWGDGTTAGEQLISGVTPDTTTPIRLYARVFSGASIEFYVNGVLKYTATTNVPAGDITAFGSRANVWAAAVYPTVGTTDWSLYVLQTSFSWLGQ